MEVFMKTTIPKDAIIMDIQDKESWSKYMQAFNTKQIPIATLDEVEAILGEAQAFFSKGNMVAADQAFRKTLVAVAYCEAELQRKRKIVIECAERLLIVLPQIGMPAELNFSELEAGSGFCRLYAFQIAKKSERQRLVTVIADRIPMHDAPSDFDMDMLEDEAKDAPYIQQDKIPRNAPCPCGSGKKFKACCGKKGGKPSKL
jgi:hypothetical protein